MQNKTLILAAAALVATAVATGCATGPSPAELDQQALAMLKASFRDQGIATVDRLDQDLGQKACSSDKAPAEDVAKKIEADALASVKWPNGGQYVGDWREGEKLAQNGRGMTWTDKSAEPTANGANCYNCHEIDKKEISYGTIGPSLLGYGKLRDFKESEIKAAYEKIYDSHASFPCSLMPRFGANKVLSMDQIKDLVALLMAKDSPVNK